jgi:hypothetical protein
VVSEHTLGAKERDDGNGVRASLWGLAPGRALPEALSSGVVRATKNHYHLMERWWELLQSPVYQDVQKRAWRDRPIHMLGDQDVLTALLTSAEFAHFPIQVLQRGKHIIQFDGVWGYTVAERLTNLLGVGPSFVHSGAGKPWSDPWLKASTLREHVKKVYLDVSPYTTSAIRFKGEVDCDTDWMKPHYALTRFLRSIGLGRTALVGLPLAVILDFARVFKRLIDILVGNKWLGQGKTASIAGQ